MTEPGNKSLLEMTDKELEERYRQSLERVQFSANDYYEEIGRRVRNKHSAAIRRLTWVTAFLTLIATIVTVIALFPMFCPVGE